MNIPPLYVVAGIRTPFCRAGGPLADFDAVDLGRMASSALFASTGLDPAVVDETIFGCVGQPANAANIARVIALRAGVPLERPAMTVHRNCASGLEAVTTAQEKLVAGQGRAFLVGGTESMSQMPMFFRHEAAIKFAMLSRARSFGGKVRAATAFRPADFMPLLALRMGLTDPVAELNMGDTAEVLAREFHITREEQDAFAVRSHTLAAGSHEARRGEIATVYAGKKEVTAVNEDNGIRSDTSLDKLARLPALFEPLTGSVTAGNSSQITDGAVALLVCDEATVSKWGMRPLGRLVSHAYTGCEPERMGLGPVKAMAAALGRAGWKPEDLDVVEINEAFAAQTLAVLKCLKDPASARMAGLDQPLGGFDESRVNAQGGAIALGHPVGASGARLVLTALHQLRQHGGRRALVSLCIGGGQGGAACFEAL